MRFIHSAVILACAIAQTACSDSSSPPDIKAEEGTLYAGTALWDDPQNEPHPSFNWPTLSSPPSGPDLPPYWAPIPARSLPAHITGLEHVAQAQRVPSGGGLAAFGGLAVLPGFGTESTIVDIRDPSRPRKLSSFNSGNSKHGLLSVTHRGAAMIAYPSGRLVTAISTDTVIDVWDITDPLNPLRLPELRPAQGSHKLGVVPGTPIVYNAATAGGSNLAPDNGVAEPAGFTEIFDLSNPDRPRLVQNFQNGYSCHHIFFWNNRVQNKFRAICAGVEYTQIWDTADPRNPRVIVSLPVHHGVPGTPSTAVVPVAFSHSAGLNRSGTVLYVGDENGGGGLPPGCVASVETPEGTISMPVGAIWFYDVSNEAHPLLQGWYSASMLNSSLRSCTAHHGRLVPDPEGRDLLAMSFYGDGVILLDFSNPALPRTVAQFSENSNTWETWYHSGYLLTGDLERGMDVLTFRQ